jgi:hypothetical protein
MSILKKSVFVFYNLHALHHSYAKRRIESLPHFQRKLFSIFLPHFYASPFGLAREYQNLAPAPRTIILSVSTDRPRLPSGSRQPTRQAASSPIPLSGYGGRPHQ